MDGWVKTKGFMSRRYAVLSFNPCFNGWMGKDYTGKFPERLLTGVSILVLMDGWVKTTVEKFLIDFSPVFQSLF